MGKLFCIVGQSGTGKDTICAKLYENDYIKNNFTRLVYHTNRPIRTGEIDGVNYVYHKEKNREELMRNYPSIVEIRTYPTKQACYDWSYFTLLQDVDPDKDYIVSASDDQYENYLKYFGSDVVVPIYIYLPQYTRLMRMVDRLKLSKNEETKDKDAIEICRRFMQDMHDYDRSVITSIPDQLRVCNIDLDQTISQVLWLILQNNK